jgi:hypothetical protein
MKDSNMYSLSGFARIDQLLYQLMNQLSKQPFGDVLLFSELPLFKVSKVVSMPKESSSSAEFITDM